MQKVFEVYVPITHYETIGLSPRKLCEMSIRLVRSYAGIGVDQYMQKQEDGSWVLIEETDCHHGSPIVEKKIPTPEQIAAAPILEYLNFMEV